MTAAVVYDDKRAHFVFSDKTALILHPNGDCVTLFARNGQKIRQLVRYATNSAAKESQSGALSKTLLALQFYNTYGAEPVIVRDEQLNPDLTFSKLYKYTKASWPGLDNMQDYITRLDDGNLTLRCSDDEEIATVTLSSSGFQVMCSFLYLLPYKKPQWVELNDLERSVMSVGGQSEGGRSHTTTSRRMKMAYEYTKVT